MYSQCLHCHRFLRQARGNTARRRCPFCLRPLPPDAQAGRALSEADRVRNTTCTVCRRTLRLDQAARRLCDSPQCRRRHLRQLAAEGAAREAERLKRRRRLLRAALRMRAKAVGKGDKAAARALPIVFLPSNNLQIVPLPQQRRTEFERHLSAIVKHAFDRPAAGDDVDRATEEDDGYRSGSTTPCEAAVLRNACATCRGRCCRSGEGHAFLNDEAVQRYRQAHPSDEPDEVLGAYLSHLPASSYEGSCVYHSQTGCCLPRPMRADICNSFYCNEAERTRRRIGGGSAFAAAVESGEIVRAAIIGADRLQVVLEDSPRREDATMTTVRTSADGPAA